MELVEERLAQAPDGVLTGQPAEGLISHRHLLPQEMAHLKLIEVEQLLLPSHKGRRPVPLLQPLLRLLPGPPHPPLEGAHIDRLLHGESVELPLGLSAQRLLIKRHADFIGKVTEGRFEEVLHLGQNGRLLGRSNQALAGDVVAQRSTSAAFGLLLNGTLHMGLSVGVTPLNSVGLKLEEVEDHLLPAVVVQRPCYVIRMQAVLNEHLGREGRNRRSPVGVYCRLLVQLHPAAPILEDGVGLEVTLKGGAVGAFPVLKLHPRRVSTGGEHLLLHRSGLPAYGVLPLRRAFPPDLIVGAPQYPLLRRRLRLRQHVIIALELALVHLQGLGVGEEARQHVLGEDLLHGGGHRSGEFAGDLCSYVFREGYIRFKWNLLQLRVCLQHTSYTRTNGHVRVPRNACGGV